MSDCIPIDVLEDIMKWLPVRSLMQFRSVSKEWKSLIDSRGFIDRYSLQQRHLFIRFDNRADPYGQFMLIADDENHEMIPPLNRISLNPPPCILEGRNRREYYHVIGSSHGLVCLHAVADVVDRAVIWNPSIRRAFEAAVPNVASRDLFDTVLGFGICRQTKDPKMVKINYVEHVNKLGRVDVIPSQVDVFSLRTKAWRSLQHNLPRITVLFDYSLNTCYTVDIDGVIYWLATDWNTVDGGRRGIIISFDATSEEFGEVSLPDILARSHHTLYMSKLRESLVVLEYVDEPNGMLFNIWKMEGEGGLGLSKTFSELFTFRVNTPELAFVLGFRQRGDPLIEITDEQIGELFSYELDSKRISNLGFDGFGHSLSVQPYMETLFLHDHPNLTVLT